jgi:hypothetical protein
LHFSVISEERNLKNLKKILPVSLHFINEISSYLIFLLLSINRKNVYEF